MSSTPSLFATCLSVFAICLAGCTGKKSTEGQGNSTAPPASNAHSAHPTLGPHNGHLIELGNDEYHAELLDDAESVTIYILNGAADTQVPIDSTELTINVKHDGQPEQFKLAASPDQNDPAGKSSRFVSNDVELAGHIEEEGAEPRLVLLIEGKSYRGNLVHEH